MGSLTILGAFTGSGLVDRSLLGDTVVAGTVSGVSGGGCGTVLGGWVVLAVGLTCILGRGGAVEDFVGSDSGGLLGAAGIDEDHTFLGVSLAGSETGLGVFTGSGLLAVAGGSLLGDTAGWGGAATISGVSGGG